MFENINYNDFPNICRTCLENNNNLTPIIQDNIIIEVLQNVPELNINVNNETELPNKICGKCAEKIHEIHAFFSQCKQTAARLNKCLANKITTTIKEEITIDEDPIKIEKEQEPLNTFEIYIKTEINDEPELDAKKKYKCATCNRTFMRTYQFNRHKRIHDEARTYKCDICEKIFAESNHLLVHKRVHAHNIFHECNVCCKMFRIEENLKVHMQLHTNDKPFKCEVCSREFHQECALMYHKKIHPELKSPRMKV